VKPKLNAIFYKFEFLSNDNPETRYMVTAESETAARMLLPAWEKKAELVSVRTADECHAGVFVTKGSDSNGF